MCGNILSHRNVHTSWIIWSLSDPADLYVTPWLVHTDFTAHACSCLTFKRCLPPALGGGVKTAAQSRINIFPQTADHTIKLCLQMLVNVLPFNVCFAFVKDLFSLVTGCNCSETWDGFWKVEPCTEVFEALRGSTERRSSKCSEPCKCFKLLVS